MPVCNACDNREAFAHDVRGVFVRYYDPETGEYLSEEDESAETQEVWCDDCGSHDVTF